MASRPELLGEGEIPSATSLPAGVTRLQAGSTPINSTRPLFELLSVGVTVPRRPLEPGGELVHAVVAPEQLLTEPERRNAEYPRGQRRFRGPAERFLDLRRNESISKVAVVQPDAPDNLAQHLHVRQIATLAPTGVRQGNGERQGFRTTEECAHRT